jgi:anti-anti-sigma factor
MTPIGFLSVTVSHDDRVAVPSPGITSVVVWLGGEHDVSTVGELSAGLAEAIRLGDADVVVDVTEVQYMGAAIVGVLYRARELLRARSRCLVLRSPPLRVRRVLELCGDTDLLPAAEDIPLAGPAGALRTWVPIPVSGLVSSVGAGGRDDELTTAVAGPGAP